MPSIFLYHLYLDSRIQTKALSITSEFQVTDNDVAIHNYKIQFNSDIQVE